MNDNYLFVTRTNTVAESCTGHELKLDDLYALACYLVLDECQAVRLLTAVLRENSRRAEGNDGRRSVFIGLLVQTYLEQCRSLSRHFNPLSILVALRGRRKPTESSALEDGLIKLCPQERVCLILRERLGLSVAEIAEITGLGREGTRLALFSARERMRDFFPAVTG